MKRFKITLMIPTSQEIVVVDAQAAHNEATKLAAAPQDDGLAAIVQSIEFIEDVNTESRELNFGDDIT